MPEEENILSEFGERFRRIRKEKGISQDELEDLAGVHGNMVGRIERGERAANIVQLYKISKALGIDIIDFFQDPPEEIDE